MDSQRLVVVSELLLDTGESITKPADILHEFQSFFKPYIARALPRISHPCWTLCTLSLLTLSDEEAASLDADISIQEIVKAVNSSPPNKIPGPDCYKLQIEHIAPRLCKVFSESYESWSLPPPPPPSMYQAHIILIPKPGKDLKYCASYTPISLYNYNLKVMTKVLATRLTNILPSLVSIDQTGFIPGKSTDINLRRVLTHLQLPPDESASRVLVMLDIEKVLIR